MILGAQFCRRGVIGKNGMRLGERSGFRHEHITFVIVFAASKTIHRGSFVTLSRGAFWFDYSDKVEERTVRAWQLLTTKAPGNSGKKAALQYLNSKYGWCLLRACKRRVPLIGIDLSIDGDNTGAYLLGVDLRDANLLRANLSGADLHEAKSVEQYQLDPACGDDRTILPEGLTVLQCSEVYWYDEIHGKRKQITPRYNGDIGLSLCRDDVVSEAPFRRISHPPVASPHHQWLCCCFGARTLSRAS